MRWLLATVTISSLAMTGCPSEFGKDGRVNKAVHKDMMDLRHPALLERAARGGLRPRQGDVG